MNYLARRIVLLLAPRARPVLHWLTQLRKGRLKSIGITSARNKIFCESLGCYDHLITYDQLDKLDASRRVVMVDMAGSASVIASIHHHFRENMVYSCLVGATHHDQVGSVKGLPGAKPEFFFAPTHMQQRSRQLGIELYSGMLVSDYAEFRLFCDQWLTVKRSGGEEAVTATYQQVLAGSVEPNIGHVVSFCLD